VRIVLRKSWNRHGATPRIAASIFSFIFENPLMGRSPSVIEKTHGPVHRGSPCRIATAAGDKGTSCAASPFIR
jgi:hypothetical protein